MLLFHNLGEIEIVNCRLFSELIQVHDNTKKCKTCHPFNWHTIDYYTRDFSSFQYPLFTTKIIIFFFFFRDSLFTVSQSITFVNSAFICMEFGFVI